LKQGKDSELAKSAAFLIQALQGVFVIKKADIFQCPPNQKMSFLNACY
jgi:hypothetical protein